MNVSCSCSLDVRRHELANLFVNLLCDQSRWVSTSFGVTMVCSLLELMYYDGVCNYVNNYIHILSHVVMNKSSSSKVFNTKR